MKKILLRALMTVTLGANAAHATSFYLTVAGLGGEPDYEQRFAGWASDANKALSQEKNAKVDTLSGAQATKANIMAKLDQIAQQAKADDTFVLTLIGHGSFDDIDYKFNLPGKDLSGSELAFALDRIPARQLVVLATSASGGAIQRLQKEKRVLVSATRAGTERNAVTFARFWVEALRDPAADSDKDQIVTALEAYNYAQNKTKDFYTGVKRLATEHAVLDDTGKKAPEAQPSPANGQGMIANRFPILHLGAAAAAMANPAKQQLLARKDQIESAIDELKYRKAAMEEADYQKALRPLLLDLAKVQAELDQ